MSFSDARSERAAVASAIPFVQIANGLGGLPLIFTSLLLAVQLATIARSFGPMEGQRACRGWSLFALSRQGIAPIASDHRP
jgi:hypothetical protein